VSLTNKILDQHEKLENNKISLENPYYIIDDLSVDDRLTISNMVVECGGKVGIMAPDQKTCEYSGLCFNR